MLLVEDEPAICFLFNALLKGHYVVRLAGSGDEGLQLIAAEPPFAVILSDYSLPSINGLDFLMQVKERSPSSVRILLSGHDPASIVMRNSDRESIFRFLSKPLKRIELLDAVEAAVEEWRSATES